MDMDSIKRLSGERPPAVVLGDLALVRPLGMAGIPVILGSGRPEDETLLSRHVRGSCVVPGWTGEHSSSSAQALTQLGARIHAVLGCKVPLLYESDVHLDLIYRHRQELAEHYLFILNDEALAWALYDKQRFYDVAVAAGVRVPATWWSGREIEEGTRELRGPIVVKPKRKTSYHEIQRSLFGGKGKARVFAARAELLSHPAFERYKDELIVQEHIDGHVSDLVSFHGYADETGQILGSFTGRKSRTSPMFGGESSFIELTCDPTVHAVGREVAGKLALKGPFKIDLIRDARDGDLLVLEVNARFNLWHYLGAVDGVNLPLVAYEYLLHGTRPSPAPTATPKHRWVDLYRDYQAFREQREAGDLSFSRWLLSLADPNNIYAVFAWDDPKPFAAWARKLIRQKRAHGVLRNRL
jgi:D-aspartate ligase